MRRNDILISSSRSETESQNFSPDTGIQDSEFIQYLNDAQDRVISNIFQVYPNEYLKEVIIPVSGGVALYNIPIDCYLGSKLKLVEYSPNNDPNNYYTLEKGVVRERFNGIAGVPSFYIRKGPTILLNPGPATSGSIRLTYFYKLPTLDIRRGKVSAVTLNPTSRSITSLTIDLTTMTTDDINNIQGNGYMTIVDKDGIVQMNQIPVSMIDPNTGILTLDGPFSFISGQSIAVGNWVCMGKNATTHSQLDDSCERYLLAHCNWKVEKRDSSVDSIEANEELISMLTEIVNAYKDADDDIDYITVLDIDYLSFS
jgi:hypothetical protein